MFSTDDYLKKFVGLETRRIFVTFILDVYFTTNVVQTFIFDVEFYVFM